LTEYKIEHGIPIPESRMARITEKREKKPPTGKNAQLLAKMQVGDSFLAPLEEVQDALNKFYVPANRMGMRIATRKVDGGVRVWRTE